MYLIGLIVVCGIGLAIVLDILAWVIDAIQE